jgi:hypothetical protein
MKITKSQLKQIIKEELEKVLNENVDLKNLAGEIARRNKMGKWMKWKTKEIYEDPTGAFGEMLTAAWSHWTGDRLPMGLSREHQAALKSSAVQTKLRTLLSTAQAGSVCCEKYATSRKAFGSHPAGTPGRAYSDRRGPRGNRVSGCPGCR